MSRLVELGDPALLLMLDVVHLLVGVHWRDCHVTFLRCRYRLHGVAHVR